MSVVLAESSQDRAPLTELAYRELKRLILDNTLAPGTTLLEHEVASLLGISRTPARAAMERLAEDGIVEVRPRHGMRVLPLSAEDMREIYVILTALESQAAQEVASKGLMTEQLEELRQAVADMEASLNRDDLSAWAAADERFHRVLVDSCDNKRLRNLIYQFWDQSHRARMTTLRIRPKPTNSNKDHSALVEAIEQRKSELAGDIHRLHRARNGEMLVRLLQESGLSV